MLPEFNYVKAESVGHALALLGDPGSVLLAGGTDLIVDMRERRRLPATVIDISEIAGLSAIRVDETEIRIGACVTVGALGDHPAIREELPSLVCAIRGFADFLTRNKATIGGNVANASPGADLVVPLLASESSIVLLKQGADRRLTLDQFLRGPRKTALERGELLAEIVIPRHAPAGQAYEKLGLKHGGAIAVVSCAVLMDAARGSSRRVRVALGAVAPRPFRSAAAEASLEGRPFTAQGADEAARLAAESANPITDVRGSAEYRTAMVRALVRRCLDNAWNAAQAGVRG